MQHATFDIFYSGESNCPQLLNYRTNRVSPLKPRHDVHVGKFGSEIRFGKLEQLLVDDEENRRGQDSVGGQGESCSAVGPDVI